MNAWSNLLQKFSTSPDQPQNLFVLCLTSTFLSNQLNQKIYLLFFAGITDGNPEDQLIRETVLKKETHLEVAHCCSPSLVHLGGQIQIKMQRLSSGRLTTNWHSLLGFGLISQILLTRNPCTLTWLTVFIIYWGPGLGSVSWTWEGLIVFLKGCSVL